MGAAHAPALVGGWRSFASNGFDLELLGGCVGLTLTMIFFALKVRDAAFLRLKPDRRAFVAVCMVVALLHLDAVRPGNDPTMVPECTALVATTWVVAGSLPIRRELTEALPRARAALKCHTSVISSVDTVWIDALRPHCWVLALRLYALRAPPAWCCYQVGRCRARFYR